jgi:hypothetical protein
LINLIFGSSGEASVLAHASPHSVIGLTLPPIDANYLFFINLAGLSDRLEKKMGFFRGIRFVTLTADLYLILMISNM